MTSASTATPQAVTKYPHATFCWVEVQTNNAEGGKRFYSELLGWTAQDTPMGDGTEYTTFLLHGAPVAGFYAGDPALHSGKIPPHWSSYISVDDLDAVMEKIEAAGGKVIMPPAEVMTLGRMAVIQDPTGAYVSFWEARDMIGSIYVNTPGALIWNELLTRDPSGAADFYGKVLGWTSHVDQSDDMAYTLFMNGERAAGGVFEITPEMGDLPPNWMVYFDVADVDASVAKAKALGATVIREPFDSSAGRIAVLDDPQGAGFNLIQSINADPPPQG